MKLGILLFDTGVQVDLEFIFQYATSADELGYNRFWLGSHFDGGPNKAWCSPEILIPIIAGMTDHISVGTAGMILRLENPYKLALNFKLIHNLFHGRIDLGIAGGTTAPEAVKALTGLTNDQVAELDFGESMNKLLFYFRNEYESTLNKVYIPPYLHSSPTPWMLSTSARGYGRALEHELNYSRSLFHTYGNPLDYKKQETLDFINAYKKRHKKKPEVNLAFTAMVADTEEEAKRKFKESYYSNPESNYRANFIGTIEQLQKKIVEWVDLYGVEDFVMLDLDTDLEARMKTIKDLSFVIQMNRSLATV